MASTGKIQSDKWNGRYLSFEWTATPSTTTPGLTTVSWALYGRGGTSSPTTYYTKAELTVNGTQVWRIWDESTSYANSKKKSGSFTVNHRWDGEGSFSVNLYVVKIYDVLDWYTNAATITLDSNKPNSVNFDYPEVISDEEIPFNIGYENLTEAALQSIKVGITGADRSEIIPLRTMVTNTNGNIGLGNYSFDFSSEINKLYTAAANTNSLKVYLTLQEEYSGYTYTENKVITFNVVNADPTLSPKVVDSNSVTKTLTGSTDSAPKFILGHSNASVTFNTSTKKQATIASQTVMDNKGNVLRSGDGAISPINDTTLSFKVVDSRGNAATVSKTLTTIPYLTPNCQIKSVVLNSSTQLKVTISGVVFYGSFGSKSNTFTVKYRYKNDSEGGSYGSWTSINPTINSQNFTYDFNATVTNAYQNYTFQVQLSDALTTVESKAFVYTTGQEPVLKVKDSNNIVHTLGIIKGQVPGASAYEQAKKVGFQGTEQEFIQKLLNPQAFPIGAIYTTFMPYNKDTGAGSPMVLFGGDWELIEGGFLYGQGDTAPTYIGEETHVLTTSEMLSHTHKADYYRSSSNSSSSKYNFRYNASFTYYSTKPSFSYKSVGNSEPHENMPPYVSANIWKRVG